MKKSFLTLAISASMILAANAQDDTKISWKVQNDTLFISGNTISGSAFDEGKKRSTLNFASWGINSSEWDGTLGQLSFMTTESPLVISEGVTTISDGAFGGFAIVSASIPNSVVSIGKGAFFDCENLVIVNLPCCIKVIEPYTFYGCESLEAINVDETNEKFCSIDGVLYSKDLTALILVPNAKNGSVRIPENVAEISNYAVYNCALTDFYVSWKNPPIATDNIFGSSKSKCKIEKLHIPAGTKNTYKQAGWTKYFKKLIEEKNG
ncbi:MAG: leucine-rich repeat domain-containing protein [Dysgonamonadaceae bacterium]|jgi:hypothetical protein|nr:leucine-rich repeat domain-containing protein [Dysgonamonadaceae bacterium]